MTKCNENMNPGNSCKGGYLRVERNVLKAIFGANEEQRHLAKVLLCVQTFTYFSEGVVCFNDFSFVCRAGEWITSYSEIAQQTGLCRKTIKRCLNRLERAGFLYVKDLMGYKLISLNNYVLPKEVSENPNSSSPVSRSAGNTLGGDLFTEAFNFYANQNNQKGAVNG